MIFTSLEFIVFLFVLILLYYQVRKSHQWFVMLLASSVFLGHLSVNFLVYTYLVIALNFFLGQYIDRQPDKKRRYHLYIGGIVFNIGQLVFFKYINFLIENFNAFIGIFNQGNAFAYMDIILPVGISYYTFECIGYLIEVYRGSSKSEKHPGLFASYILFFPKLLAGPIERARSFIPELKKAHQVDPALLSDGLIQIFWGLFKKLVIADRIAIIVNQVYGNVDEFSGMPLIITFVLQVFHIYFDFSGYTDIALGMGKLFGLRLTNNFERPLLAQSVSMFWRKWHITLTNWCNDYIFKRILLKRMRWKKWAAVYGVFITFLVVGIWHGAGWNFVVLGALQGVAINYEFFTKKQRLQMAAQLPPYWVKLFSRVGVFLFFAFTLIFFNASSLSDACYFIIHLFSGFEWNILESLQRLGLPVIDYIPVMFGTLTVILVDYLNEKGILIRKTLNTKPAIRWALYYGLILSVLIFGQSTGTNFVYFQF